MLPVALKKTNQMLPVALRIRYKLFNWPTRFYMVLPLSVFPNFSTNLSHQFWAHIPLFLHNCLNLKMYCQHITYASTLSSACDALLPDFFQSWLLIICNSSPTLCLLRKGFPTPPNPKCFGSMTVSMNDTALFPLRHLHYLKWFCLLAVQSMNSPLPYLPKIDCEAQE